jgi:hypothetical protein
MRSSTRWEGCSSTGPRVARHSGYIQIQPAQSYREVRKQGKAPASLGAEGLPFSAAGNAIGNHGKNTRFAAWFLRSQPSQA